MNVDAFEMYVMFMKIDDPFMVDINISIPCIETENEYIIEEMNTPYDRDNP
jgi:hypothetical protein